MIDRRIFLASTAALALPGCGLASDNVFADLEPEGGRLGVHARHLGSGVHTGMRTGERFAMCSTFKWVLAGMVLELNEAGRFSMDDHIIYSRDEIVFYSPRIEANPGTTMSISDLCDAAVTISDNTAANLLFQEVGGPEGFTARLRELGDTVTRLDRMEPELNSNTPGDPRDTTTPEAMTALMQRFLFDDLLTRDSRAQLRNWMIGASTGLSRLRAGIPEGWTAGDKTGTSGNGAFNDVAFAVPPDGSDNDAIVIACYLNAPGIASEDANAIHAEVARRVVAELG